MLKLDEDSGLWYRPDTSDRFVLYPEHIYGGMFSGVRREFI